MKGSVIYMGKDKDNNYISIARHSMAHVLAKAVCDIFPDVKLGIGPAIDNGCYYDFDLPHTIREEDFEAIEKRMAQIIASDDGFEMQQVADPAADFADQPYKLDLITDLTGEPITVYHTGNFSDLCAGPHVENMRELRNWGFKVASIAGAYWRGDSTKPMLQRVYVYAFPTRPELKKYLQFLEEAKKRDHRLLGNQLDLFFFDETAPGMPYWQPKGLKVYNTLLAFSREVHENWGYQEISAPLLNSSVLWQQSGHWEHYQDDMFKVELENDQVYALKPMNCPNAILTYRRKNRSYRDLPLRYSQLDYIHRDEAQGALHGLMRVQQFRQDDAHIFIAENQIAEEINKIIDITDVLYDVFGLKYRVFFSTRPDEGYLGDIETWDAAESALKQILNTRFKDNYEINEGDGAFYGPKIDIMVSDVLNREWQLGTIQLDFQLAARFNLHYTDRDGLQKTPVIIHRTLYGSLERFIGILIEHFAGKFPFWLSPLQIGIVPVHTEHEAYAQQIADKLGLDRFRVSLDTTDGTMGNKIKSFRHQMTPYIIIVGEKEVADGTISLRTRNGTQINDISLDSFVDVCRKLQIGRLTDLIEEI